MKSIINYFRSVKTETAKTEATKTTEELVSAVNMKGMSAGAKCPAVKARLEAYIKPVFTLEPLNSKQVSASEKRAQIAIKRTLKMKAKKQHAALVRERKANA